MQISEYIEYIEKGEIPPETPVIGDYRTMFTIDEIVEEGEARSTCTGRGLWTLIDKRWTRELANWIGNRKCLEVMAGGGWLAKALHEHGVDIVATDDFSWNGSNHKNMERVFPVIQMDGVVATQTFVGAEVLIVSWPPYESEDICKICECWGHERPIIYIGEGNGGCNAGDEFWSSFRELDVGEFALPSWRGLHDCIRIGVYEPAL